MTKIQFKIFRQRKTKRIQETQPRKVGQKGKVAAKPGKGVFKLLMGDAALPFGLQSRHIHIYIDVCCSIPGVRSARNIRNGQDLLLIRSRRKGPCTYGGEGVGIR